MKIIEVKNYKELSRIASDIIIEEINKKPIFLIDFESEKILKNINKNQVKQLKNRKVNFSR